MVNALAWQSITPHRPITPEDTGAILKTTATGDSLGAGIASGCFLPQSRVKSKGIMIEVSTERHFRVSASTRSSIVH